MIDPHGGNTYAYDRVLLDFSVNLNPLGMPEEIISAVREHAAEYDAYPDTKCRALRRAVARREQLPESQLVFGNGAADLIIRLCGALKPQKALVAAPTFSEYESAVLQSGGEVVRFALDEAEDFKVTEAYAAAVTPDVDMVFLCNPNNPTGRLVEDDVVEALLEACRRQHAWLVIDECFLSFTVGRSAVRLLGTYDRLLILRAFTKMYSMAGLRLGYLICADAAAAAAVEAYGQSWSVSTPAQVAGVAAMALTEHPAKTRAFVREERAWLAEALEQLGLKVYPADGNFILFRSVPELWQKAMDRGIMLRSCANFVGLDARYYRIGIKSREKNQQLLTVLAEILR